MDNPPDFTTIYLPIIVATTTGIIGTGLGIYNFIQKQKDRKPTFGKFQRRKDTVQRWQIFLHSPTKPIRKCNATFKGQRLPLWDGKGYERSIALGEGVNFTMPEGISKDDNGMVIIKSGRQTIEKSKFNEMETVGD